MPYNKSMRKIELGPAEEKPYSLLVDLRGEDRLRLEKLVSVLGVSRVGVVRMALRELAKKEGLDGRVQIDPSGEPYPREDRRFEIEREDVSD